MKDINKNKIALVLTLEENKTNLYEYECLLCVEAWRKNKHQLSDIDILIYVNKQQKIKKATFDLLKSYKNVYIVCYDNPLNCMNFNFYNDAINMFYSKYFFEKFQTKYDYGIFLDLDMYIIKDFHVNTAFNNKNIFCIYSQQNLKNIDQTYLHWKKYFNSIRLNYKLFKCSFCVLNRQNKIIDAINNLIRTDEFADFFLKNQKYKDSNFFCNEALFDFAWHIGLLNYSNCIFVDDFYLEQHTFKYAPFIHEHIKTFNDYHKLRKALKLK